MILERLIEAGLLDVDQLAANRKNRLVTPVAALLGRATGRIALDDVKLGQVRIALRTIRQFSGKTATGQRAFADCLPRFAGGFAGARRRQHFVKDPFRDRRVLIEERHQPVVNHRVHDSVDLGIHELHLGLRFETRIRQLDAQDANQTFANIVAGNCGILVLQEAVRLRVLVDGLGERGAETGQVRSAIRIWNRIGERKNLIVVAVVILEDDVDEDFIALPRKDDRFRMNDLLVFPESVLRTLRCRACRKTFPSSMNRRARR